LLKYFIRKYFSNFIVFAFRKYFFFKFICLFPIKYFTRKLVTKKIFYSQLSNLVHLVENIFISLNSIKYFTNSNPFTIPPNYFNHYLFFFQHLHDHLTTISSTISAISPPLPLPSSYHLLLHHHLLFHHHHDHLTTTGISPLPPHHHHHPNIVIKKYFARKHFSIQTLKKNLHFKYFLFVKYFT